MACRMVSSTGASSGAGEGGVDDAAESVASKEAGVEAGEASLKRSVGVTDGPVRSAEAKDGLTGLRVVCSAEAARGASSVLREVAARASVRGSSCVIMLVFRCWITPCDETAGCDVERE